MAAVPATPDAEAPADGFVYAIDAAICGEAMLEAHARNGDPRLRQAAIGFGDALLAFARAHERVFARAETRGGFCEYARVIEGELAYACNSYVKNLLAVGFLRDLSTLTGDDRYLARARAARRFLVPGLEGGWEYADAEAALNCETADCPVVWRRVPGPHHEPDRYVYGDTLAYALAGLFAFEGASEDVRRLYARFAGYEGEGETRAYDGGVAWAGYMDVAARAPDPESAYYDLVTIGILSPLRRAIAPAHDARAWAFVERALDHDAQLGWGVAFDGRPIGIDRADNVSLSHLAREVLSADPASRAANRTADR